jgi:hypothetical protein
MPTLPSQNTAHPKLTYLISTAFYDWVRRSGVNLNITQLIKTLNSPLKYNGSGPQVHWFQIQQDGSINYTVTSTTQKNLCVSQDQWRAISGLAIDLSLNGSVSSNIANYNFYDVELTDFVNKEGRINGGKHGGEPLSNPGVMVNNPSAANYTAQTLQENPTLPYQSFLTNSGANVARPTYTSEGIAFDVTFRQRQIPQ